MFFIFFMNFFKEKECIIYIFDSNFDGIKFNNKWKNKGIINF